MKKRRKVKKINKFDKFAKVYAKFELAKQRRIDRILFQLFANGLSEYK